jgi:hypothetical protein
LKPTKALSEAKNLNVPAEALSQLRRSSFPAARFAFCSSGDTVVGGGVIFTGLLFKT